MESRPFRDSDITATQVWYVAADGAEHLPFPTAYYSRWWDGDDILLTGESGPGEVGDAARPINYRVGPPGTGVGHICGTEDDFARGAVFDPDVDVQYDSDGLPLCCDHTPVPIGGAEVDGTAVLALAPGLTCLASTDIVLDQIVLATHPGGSVEHWWRVPSLPTSIHHLNQSASTAALISRVGYVSCGFMASDPTEQMDVTPCSNHTPPIVGPVWVRITSTGAAGSYQFTLSAGAC